MEAVIVIYLDSDFVGFHFIGAGGDEVADSIVNASDWSTALGDNASVTFPSALETVPPVSSTTPVAVKMPGLPVSELAVAVKTFKATVDPIVHESNLSQRPPI